MGRVYEVSSVIRVIKMIRSLNSGGGVDFLCFLHFLDVSGCTL